MKTKDWYSESWAKEAYEGVDSLSNFRTMDDILRYREQLLNKTKPQTKFIRSLFTKSNIGHVLEIGCGNGRLLIDIVSSELLERNSGIRAVGIDLSDSRIAFAEQWAMDLGIIGSIAFTSGDILTFPQAQSSDLVICVTGAFQYFKPMGRESDILEFFKKSLKEGGKLVLEVYNLPAERRLMLQVANNRLKTWDALPPEDPFAYYLNNWIYDPWTKIMTHEKTFIHRSGRIDDLRIEYLKYYTPAELIDRLSNVGFKEISFFDGWDNEVDPNKTIVVAS